MFSPYFDKWLSSVAQTRQYIEKRLSASFKGIKNEAFPVKNLEFKILILILCNIHLFWPKFQKNHVLSFLLMSCLCVVNGT